ncbi:MAG: DUF523 domain-containing protein [Corticimicrobacter sp.]|uniref:DUF523 domain-containing protein n=1 Tax=Corticimicrobacter sp. TaxID=2678536 RepID=UPI0032D9D668
MNHDSDTTTAALAPVSAPPQRVLVSACLMGEPVRYDGAHKRLESTILQRWRAEGRVVVCCPELAGGLSVPRLPAEIAPGAEGHAVLAGRARVLDRCGRDLSAAFVEGAARALALVRQHGIRVAVLKEGSPSCGTGHIYDGTFGGTMVAAQGVTAALLIQAGLSVFSETQMPEADAALRAGLSGSRHS